MTASSQLGGALLAISREEQSSFGAYSVSKVGTRPNSLPCRRWQLRAATAHLLAPFRVSLYSIGYDPSHAGRRIAPFFLALITSTKSRIEVSASPKKSEEETIVPIAISKFSQIRVSRQLAWAKSNTPLSAEYLRALNGRRRREMRSHLVGLLSDTNTAKPGRCPS